MKQWWVCVECQIHEISGIEKGLSAFCCSYTLNWNDHSSVMFLCEMKPCWIPLCHDSLLLPAQRRMSLTSLFRNCQKNISALITETDKLWHKGIRWIGKFRTGSLFLSLSIKSAVYFPVSQFNLEKIRNWIRMNCPTEVWKYCSLITPDAQWHM